MAETKRFFRVDEGDGDGGSHFIVARDLDHAKQILRDHGIELTGDDGWSYQIDDPRLTGATWREIPSERAAQMKVWLGDCGTPPQTTLDQCELGDFFSSEF